MRLGTLLIALGIEEAWLSEGPAGLLDFGLPEGFAGRTHVRVFGPLRVHLASRVDQICLKLYAAVDQGPQSRHFEDLDRLRPAREELRFAARWATTHDLSEGFRDGLLAALAALGVEDAESLL